MKFLWLNTDWTLMTRIEKACNFCKHFPKSIHFPVNFTSKEQTQRFYLLYIESISWFCLRVFKDFPWHMNKWKVIEVWEAHSVSGPVLLSFFKNALNTSQLPHTEPLFTPGSYLLFFTLIQNVFITSSEQKEQWFSTSFQVEILSQLIQSVKQIIKSKIAKKSSGHQRYCSNFNIPRSFIQFSEISQPHWVAATWS